MVSLSLSNADHICLIPVTETSVAYFPGLSIDENTEIVRKHHVDFRSYCTSILLSSQALVVVPIGYHPRPLCASSPPSLRSRLGSPPVYTIHPRSRRTRGRRDTQVDTSRPALPRSPGCLWCSR